VRKSKFSLLSAQGLSAACRWLITQIWAPTRPLTEIVLDTPDIPIQRSGTRKRSSSSIGQSLAPRWAARNLAATRRTQLSDAYSRVPRTHEQQYLRLRPDSVSSDAFENVGRVVIYSGAQAIAVKCKIRGRPYWIR
jgi:hypothetical protein